MGPDRKGGAPYPDGRRDLPQLRVGETLPVIETVKLTIYRFEKSNLKVKKGGVSAPADTPPLSTQLKLANA